MYPFAWIAFTLRKKRHGKEGVCEEEREMGKEVERKREGDKGREKGREREKEKTYKKALLSR